MGDSGQNQHVWVGAANIPIYTDKEARAAIRHRSAVIREATHVIVVEVMCNVCRRPFERVWNTTCKPGAHLHGGDPDGKRKPRKGPGARPSPPSTPIVTG